MMLNKVTVVLPAYNEEETIGAVISKIKELYPDFTILVIDDGSQDRTTEAAKLAGARVIRHPYNKGNGAAIKTGIRSSEGDIIVIMDADGQHDPTHIAEMLKYFPDYDAVIGARLGCSSMPIGRRLANAVYNRLGTYVSGQRIDDLTSGFRAFKKEIIAQYLGLLPNSFSAPATSTIVLIKAGYSVKFIPIQIRPRFRGQSKIRIRDGLRFFLIILRIATLFSPLRIFLPISLLIFLLGLFYGGYMVIWHHRFTNMTQLLLVASVIIFMLGLVAEQIAMLRFSLIQENQKDQKAHKM